MTWKQFCELNNTPKKYINCGISNLNIPDDKNGRCFIEKAENWVKKPRSLLLLGEPGRGKTYFMYSLIRALIERRKVSLADLMFFRSKSLDDKICELIFDNGSASYFLRRVSEIPFLFIDDFGIERQTERTERDYYDIIDHRVSNELITIFSSNLSEMDIAKTFGPRIDSRLKECLKVTFDGPDLRESF